MKKNSDNNFGIAHLGVNFWKKLVAEDLSYDPMSNNAFLLCVDDDGCLLMHLFLPSRILSSAAVVQACINLVKTTGASGLVRMQARPAIQGDPFEINTPFTLGLYKTAKLHNLHLTEVVIPTFSSDTE